MDRIEWTCECCPNVAEAQNIQGYVTTLCSWCYNRELERRGVNVADHIDFDVAEMFPDLVHQDCASLKPATGPGWFNMIAHYLRLMENQIEQIGLEPGHVVISDIKTGRNGRISVGFHKTHECVDHVVKLLERSSVSTCAKCGHHGDIVRAKDKSDLLCSSCYVRATKWDPFEQKDT